MPMWLNSQQLRRNESIVGRAAGYKSAGKSHADVAQLAEQLICNQQVIGSSPIIGFIQFNIELYYGQIPEWPKGTDCKSAATCFGGSNPPLPIIIYAGVAELADAQDLKSCCSDTVPVRFRSPAFIERALDKSVIIDEKKLIEYVCVAQLDRALGYGPRCREFESSRARMLNSLKFLKNQGFKAIFVYADFMNPF